MNWLSQIASILLYGIAGVLTIIVSVMLLSLIFSPLIYLYFFIYLIVGRFNNKNNKEKELAKKLLKEFTTKKISKEEWAKFNGFVAVLSIVYYSFILIMTLLISLLVKTIVNINILSFMSVTYLRIVGFILIILTYIFALFKKEEFTKILLNFYENIYSKNI